LREGERLFFAFWPDAAVRARLAELGAGLRLEAPARAVPPGNLHFTLAFVGEVAPDVAARVRAIGAAQRGAPCRLRFDAFEYWPKPEVVVAAARVVAPALDRLWHRLHETLAHEGLALNPKRLRPHVTLAGGVAAQPAFAGAPLLDWTVREFSLIRSETAGAHSVYTVVGTWPLLDEP
jgi:2'-5' RNA ligase